MRSPRLSMAALAAGALFSALLLGSNPLQSQDAIYKWVDEDGVTHFSARPPEGVEYESIDTLSDVVRRVRPQTVGETEDLGDDDTPRGPLPDLPTIEVEEPDPAMVAERCEQARSNLSWMTQQVHLSTQGEDGELRRISEDERQRMIEETQAFIDEWC